MEDEDGIDANESTGGRSRGGTMGAMRNMGASDDIRFEVPQEDAAQDLCQLLESSHGRLQRAHCVVS